MRTNSLTTRRRVLTRRFNLARLTKSFRCMITFNNPINIKTRIFNQDNTSATIRQRTTNQVLTTLEHNMQYTGILRSTNRRRTTRSKTLHLRPINIRLITTIRTQLKRRNRILTTMFRLTSIRNPINRKRRTRQTILRLSNLRTINATLLMLSQTRMNNLLGTTRINRRINSYTN